MNFVRLLVLALVASSVVYICVARFLRSTRRERLEKEWDAEHPEGDPETRRAEVEKGVQAFTQTLPYRALWLIYILPVAAVGYTLLATNWN
jgi:hypothetical protein